MSPLPPQATSCRPPGYTIPLMEWLRPSLWGPGPWSPTAPFQKSRTQIKRVRLFPTRLVGARQPDSEAEPFGQRNWSPEGGIGLPGRRVGILPFEFSVGVWPGVVPPSGEPSPPRTLGGNFVQE